MAKKTRRRRRPLVLAVLALVFLVVVLLGLILYVLFPRIAGEGLEKAMRRAGLADVVVRAESVKTGSAAFSQISFRHELPAGRIFVSLRGVTAEFAFSALLRGEIAAVKVENALVAWDAKPQPTPTLPPAPKRKSAPAPFAIPEFPESALPRVPLPGITIAKVEILAPDILPLGKTELEEVALAPRLGGAELAFAWKPSGIPRMLWVPKRPLVVGASRIVALEQNPPAKLKVRVNIETKGESLTRVALASPFGFSILVRGRQGTEVASMRASGLEAEWTKTGARAKLQLEDGRGKIRIALSAAAPRETALVALEAALAPVSFEPKTNPLSSFLAAWPFPFEIESGKLSLTGNAGYDLKSGAYTYRSQLKLEGARALYGGIAATGVELACAASGGAKAHARIHCADVKVRSMEAGIEVRDIGFGVTAELASPHPSVEIQKLHANTLGGTLRAESANVKLGADNPPFTIVAEGIDLQLLLKAKQHAEFTATGTLDGTVPLRLAPEGVYVEKGEIHARSGGTIRYRPEGADALAASNPGLGLAVGALRDFQYHELRADLNYTPAGLLKMNVALKGRNPEFQRGQAVHFNVNLEENMLALFQSISVAEGFSKRMEDRVQSLAEPVAKPAPKAKKQK